MTVETVNAEVKVEGGEKGPSVSVEYDFGDTPEETNELFGADIVYAYAKRGLVIAVQSHLRGLLRSGKSVDEIRELAPQWKPGTPRAKTSPEDKMRAEWAKMSSDDRAALLRELQGEAAPAAPQRAKRSAA
jgi:hypothetical protein